MSTTPTISHLVGSSQYQAIADDSLKDEDNAAWVMELDPLIRQEWVERIGWIRLVDRLAETELISEQSSDFQSFRLGWQLLKTQGVIDKECSGQSLLTKVRDRWFGDSSPINSLCIQSWDSYVDAIAKYHQPKLEIETFDQYEAMLSGLSGSLFQVLPFLSEHHWQSACYLGVVDQFYNNLRDLQEDAEQGICYFPTELLNEFKVSRDEILQMCCFANPGYYRMMHFWLDDYLPKLRQKTSRLILTQDLHPSWQVMRDWSVHRYTRVERVLRNCKFNYVLFPQRYWAEVKRDLALQSQRQHLNQVCKVSQIYETSKISVFLGLSPTTVKSAKRLFSSLHRAQQKVSFSA